MSNENRENASHRAAGKAEQSSNKDQQPSAIHLQRPAARLTRDDLEYGVKEVIHRLQERGEPAELRIIGGAAIALWHNAARGATQDIDAVLSPADAILDAAQVSDVTHRRGGCGCRPMRWLTGARGGRC